MTKLRCSRKPLRAEKSELCDVDQIQRLSGWVWLISDELGEGAMMLTLGCLSALFGVLAMLWADGRLARGFLHSLFNC
jgi:hypothetical protein